MRAVGIILAGGNSNKMRELTHKRAVAAMPIAGSYRAIDFALSNMSNSHIQKVAVLTQYNARSLNEHLNSSKWWDFGRKQGGLYVFTPTITADNGYWYRGTADAIYQNLDFLKRCHEPYVIITSGDAVYKMDYNKVLEYHIAKKADITVVCKELDFRIPTKPSRCSAPRGCVRSIRSRSLRTRAPSAPHQGARRTAPTLRREPLRTCYHSQIFSHDPLRSR